jgi:hypothetical protein
MMQIHSPGCLLDLSVQSTRRGESGTRETEKLANGLASRETQGASAAVVEFCHRDYQFKVRKNDWRYETFGSGFRGARRLGSAAPHHDIVCRYAISFDGTARGLPKAIFWAG